MDVLRTDGDVLALERVADGSEADVRGADHPRDAGLTRAGRDGPREVPGIGGGGVHLPVGGNHDRAHALIMPEARAPPPGRSAPARPPDRPPRRRPVDSRRGPSGRSPPRRPMPSSSWSASRSIRSSARWTAERWRSSRAAISDSDASGVSRRASATARTVRGWSPSLPSASSASIAASCRPEAATDRWRFADSALMTRLSSPAQAPGDAPRLELEEARARADPAEERGDRLRALPGHDAEAATHPPRRRAARCRPGAARGPPPRRPGRRTRGAPGRSRGSASRGRGTGHAARRAGSARGPRASRGPPRGGRTCGARGLRARRGPDAVSRAARRQRPRTPAPTRGRARRDAR